MISNVQIFTTRGRGFLSNTIAFNSAPMSWMPQLGNVASHAGLCFTLDTGKKFTFESHSPQGWQLVDHKRTLAWVEKHPKAWIKYRDLNLDADEMEKVWKRCHEKLMDPAWMDYRELQIAGMLLRRIFKFRVKMSPSPVCSEAVAKILYPYYDLRVWEGKRPIGFDEITPWWVQVVPLKRIEEYL